MGGRLGVDWNQYALHFYLKFIIDLFLELNK